MTAATEELVPPKRIEVNGKRIRLRWLQQIIWSVIAANVGALIISALYYMLVQQRWHVGSHTILYLKPSWDNLFHFKGWRADRHAIRNIYEAVLATLLVKSLLANWRKRNRQAPAWYVLISPLLIILAALPVVVLGLYLLNHGLPALWHALFARHVVGNPVHVSRTLSWLTTYLTEHPWQPTVVGVLVGLVVHRVYAPAGDVVQLYFVGRAVDRTRDAIAAGEPNPYRHLPRWPWPPVIRERAAWIMQSNRPVPDRTTDIRWAVRIVMVVLIALTIYGAYIRYWVAKGHG